METKIVGYGMTKSEKDKEDIEMLFGTIEEQRAAHKKKRRKEYYQANRERELAASRLWRANNPERYKERNYLYREKNKERLRELSARYRKARKAEHITS